MGPLRLGIVSSEAGLVSFESNSLTVPEGSAPPSVAPQVRGAAAGTTLLRFDQPPGFGPVPAGRGETRLRVTPRTITLECASAGILALGLDTQAICPVGGVPEGTVIEAVSSDPRRLVLSSDSRAAGTGRVSFPPSSNTRFTIQALARSGTVEVVLSAPGFSELRLQVVLRKTEVQISSYPNSLARGSTGTVTLSLVVAGDGLSSPSRRSARAGSAIRVGVGATPEGIISFETNAVTFAAGADTAQVSVRGVAPGGAVVVLSPPEGFADPSQRATTILVQ